MPVAHDIPGLVLKNGSAILLARVVGYDGDLLTPSDVAGATYSIERLDESDIDAASQVPGHTARSLTPGNVLYATLRQDQLWDVDSQGYNFKHVIDVRDNNAFAVAGAYYRVRYDLADDQGRPIQIRFKLRAI